MTFLVWISGRITGEMSVYNSELDKEPRSFRAAGLTDPMLYPYTYLLYEVVKYSLLYLLIDVSLLL